MSTNRLRSGQVVSSRPRKGGIMLARPTGPKSRPLTVEDLKKAYGIGGDRK